MGDSVRGDLKFTQALGWLHLAGATLSGLWLLLPHPAESRDGLVLAATLGAYGLAGLLLTAGDRLPLRLLQLSMLATTGVITLALVANNQHGSVYALFYLWATLYAFCCFTTRAICVQLAAVGVAYAAALCVERGATWSDDVSRWALTLGTLVAAGWLVRTLTTRLLDREQELRVGFETSSIGLAVLSPMGHYQSVNRACEQMLGQSEAELAGVETRSLTHPDDWPIVENVARGALMGEYATAKYEARYLRGDGTYYWVLVHLTLVREPDGTPLHFFAQFEDIADRKRAEAERDAAEDQLRHQALHDALTGLPNRRALLARLELERERPDAGERRIGALVVDVDRFKLTNDSLGHDIGDALLEQIAPRLAERLGPDGLLARAGGDEFVALTGAIAGPDELEEIGNRLLAAFADPFEIGGHRLFVAASVGGALSEADAAGDAIFSEADTAMYHAKSLGGARVELFGHELRERVTRRMALENELRDVLERDELSVAYQPVVELATGKIIAAEALLRWRRRDGENVSPGEFISIAEDTGQINAIGAWVIERACEQAAAWSTDGSNIAVTVNVSARQLADRTICCELQRCLRRSGVEPSRIILEITESVLLGDSERAIETLTELRDTGVRLALDDFGTGYSSLAYLTRLPLDVLKLDRSFVSKLPGDDQAAAVTAAIMSMARGLELLVVAEGIEREEERLELLDLGCVLGQGYMFARPAPASELGQKPWSLDTEALLRAD